MFDPPIFINVRDRVRDLRALVRWLEQAGHKRIKLIDNGSSWPPLLNYLECTPHRVVYLGENLGSRALWKANLAPPDEMFVYTDPDIIPIAECPQDAVQHLHGLLLSHSGHQKAGLGLYLDDVPPELPCLGWERSLVAPAKEIQPGVFDSLVDTTFALYQPGTPHSLEAIRTGFPYQVRHTSWYCTEPDAEDRYYLDHAIAGPKGSSWAETA